MMIFTKIQTEGKLHLEIMWGGKRSWDMSVEALLWRCSLNRDLWVKNFENPESWDMDLGNVTTRVLLDLRTCK